MKQKMKTTLVGVAGFVIGIGVVLASAAGSQPGSELDPLVTKSYVDARIAAVTGQTVTVPGTTTSGVPVDNAAVLQLQTDVGELTHFIIDALTSVDSLNARMNASDIGFVVVEVSAGKTVILNAGSELIVRSGKTTAIQGTYGGLADVTSGADIINGKPVINQHLLISSRSDGRGIKLNNQGAFLLIRGGYTVQ